VFSCSAGTQRRAGLHQLQPLRHHRAAHKRAPHHSLLAAAPRHRWRRSGS
jgi:hypothetical protein